MTNVVIRDWYKGTPRMENGKNGPEKVTAGEENVFVRRENASARAICAATGRKYAIVRAENSIARPNNGVRRQHGHRDPEVRIVLDGEPQRAREVNERAVKVCGGKSKVPA